MQLELIMFVHLTANGTFTPRSRDTIRNPPLPPPQQNPKLTFIIHRWHKGIPHTKDCGIWNVNSFHLQRSLTTEVLKVMPMPFFSKRRETRTQWHGITTQKTRILRNMWERQISINGQVFIGPEFKRSNFYENAPEDSMQCVLYTVNK